LPKSRIIYKSTDQYLLMNWNICVLNLPHAIDWTTLESHFRPSKL